MKSARYREDQFFSYWAYSVVIGCMGLIVFLGVVADIPPPPQLFTILGADTLVLLFCLNILYQRTVVTDREIKIRFGFLFPLFWKTLPLHEIREARVVQYRPIRDAGGWGIRWGRFEGQPALFYNARGDRGVLLSRSPKSVVIGSKSPELLAQAIAEAVTARVVQ